MVPMPSCRLSSGDFKLFPPVVGFGQRQVAQAAAHAIYDKRMFVVLVPDRFDVLPIKLAPRLEKP